MKRIILIAAALFATSAFATGPLNNNEQGQLQGQGQAQGQLQGQLQGQAQGQAQGNLNFVNTDISNRITNDVRQNAAAFSGAGADAKSNANSGGNTQNVTVTDSGRMDYAGQYTVKNVPSVFSGNVYPTAPCMGSSTVGGAGVGFGFSVGSSWTDDECGIRETSRSFSGLGKADDALKVLCTSKYAAAAPSCAGAVAQPKE